MADNQTGIVQNAKNIGSAATDVSKAARLDFELHVALIQRTDALPKSKAIMVAWLEGRAGLNARLAK